MNSAGIREPQAALWGFYSFRRDELLKELEQAFKNATFGPGALPEKRPPLIQIIGGVAPHAGYSYSGSCAAWLYKEIAENKPQVGTVILIGTNHTGFGGIITTTTYFSTWLTPLGRVEVDLELIDHLKKEYRDLDDDALAHIREHSLEVQLPFLQFIYNETFKIVPIVVKSLDYRQAEEFARALKNAVTLLGRDTVIIASSDFTHHGSIYGYVLFTSNISSNVKKLDMEFINAILELDTKKFLSLVRKYDATVCGAGAIAIAMEYAKLFGGKVKLLRYYNSAEVTGDEDIAVGYASILFYK
ncbi:MAG: AmmeMemoRadiSam system protein B [Desulfurococcaceae archaeon]|jgi:AmmeMemoRadiSam system protein B|nr:AmmeMemoRadiSam system protein B [Desulfurococcaceae archaeon]